MRARPLAVLSDGPTIELPAPEHSGRTITLGYDEFLAAAIKRWPGIGYADRCDQRWLFLAYTESGLDAGEFLEGANTEHQTVREFLKTVPEMVRDRTEARIRVLLANAE